MEEKIYKAHKSEDGVREQSIREHLCGTAEYAKKFADVFGAGDYAAACGWYHDIGKYARLFQLRIDGNRNIQYEHSAAGAYTLRLLQKSELLPAVLCIAGHHSGLPDLGTTADGPLLKTLHAKLNRQKNRISPNDDYSAWKNDVPDNVLDVKLPEYIAKPGTPFYNCAFFVRMLYSCLVDADYLDTEDFMNGKELRSPGEPLWVLKEKLKVYLRELDEKSVGTTGKNAAINKKRCEIRDSCLRHAEHPQGLYRLTVPTGGGKTLSSMAFALRHAIAHGMSRVIYVIPYVSIIRQTEELFSHIFGKENVLAHYYSSDELCREPDSSDIETDRMQRAAENWDKPIVLTTNVQFFESLYGNKASRCRKLHNIAGSVLIFDEAQMLPPEYLMPCFRAIHELTSHYDCTAVLCTATQPALNGLLCGQPPEEIYSDVQGLYKFFRRVTIREGGKKTAEKLAAELSEKEQVLCIVNTKKSAREIFSYMKGEGCYLLTKWHTPYNIGQVLKEISQRLLDGKPCRVVATSLVEAGVDLDFPTVYREQAGLDSIIQAAGRCNREGKHSAEESIVWIFTLDPVRSIPDEISRAKAACLQTMEEQQDISSPEAIEEYFTLLYRQYLHEGLAASAFWRELPFATAAEHFKMIQTETCPVLIPSEESKDVCEAIRNGKINRMLLRQAGQYSVMLHPWEMNKLKACGAVETVGEQVVILKNPEYYKKETGIVIPD